MSAATFLFTDIEGSTRLWERHPVAMRKALASHDRLVEREVAGHGGDLFKHTGDGVAVAFERPRSALDAAAAIQRGLAAESHPDIGPLRVRMGIHTGDAERRDGDYFGLTVSRTARLMSAGHGGQVLVSMVTAALLDADDLELRDLGQHRLRDLGRPERILQLIADGVGREFPQLNTLDRVRHNLPILTTSFIGRDQEQAELIKLLHGSRVVTVTGVGGSGKTRVTLQAAADLVDEYSDGVWLVELAAVTDPDHVIEAILEALEITPAAGQLPRDALVERVTEWEALIVVDNCEHLISAAAELVEDILTHARGITVAATSRELLGVPGEVSYGLRSLRLPPREADIVVVRHSDAVRLFEERGAAARPDFRLTEANAGAVVEICRRLDGMPLAIELAAARLRTFGPAQIAEHLDQRFRLLTGGSRTALPRQQTLTATIEWSYRLLSPAEQALFRRLSVFQGGFDFEAVVAVCAGDPIDEADILELVPALVDKSLVVVDGHGDEEVRYRLLETLRQFARDRLDEAEDTDTWRERHALHFASLSSQFTFDRSVGPEAPLWQRRLLEESDNLRQALLWALDVGRPDLAVPVASGLSRVLIREGRWSEPLAWWSRIVADGDELPPPLRARALHSLGVALAYSDDPARAIAVEEESVALYGRILGDDSEREVVLGHLLALNGLAYGLYHQGRAGARNERYTELQTELLEAARAADEPFWVATALANLAHHRDPHGDPEQSRRMFAAAEEASRDLGFLPLAELAGRRAFFEFDQGEIDEARRQWQTALEHAAHDSGQLVARLLAEVGLAVCDRLLGDVSAGERFRAAVSQLFDIPDVRRGVHDRQTLLVMGALIDGADGELERVAVAAGASEMVAGLGVPVRWDLVTSFSDVCAVAHDGLGEAEFEGSYRRGAAMTLDETTQFLLMAG